jgi:formate/nitrite transporter FocA (FNT family)
LLIHLGNGANGKLALTIANNKVNCFVQAVHWASSATRYVWRSGCVTARSTTDKILAIVFPISAFVAASFEHSVANMYFIPIGLFIKAFDPAFVAKTGLDLANLTWGTFLVNNLLPVTIGNIIGGGIMVAAVYWSVYLRQPKPKAAEPEGERGAKAQPVLNPSTKQ